MPILYTFTGIRTWSYFYVLNITNKLKQNNIITQACSLFPNISTIFFFYIQVIVLAFVAALASAQEKVEEDDVEGGPSAQEVAGVRKLRLRRPRPISIDNEDGIAQGNPVPLRAGKICVFLYYGEYLY